ncbi:hypothetical protein ALT721_1700005 [Alteromonas alvinellae]
MVDMFTHSKINIDHSRLRASMDIFQGVTTKYLETQVSGFTFIQ